MKKTTILLLSLASLLLIFSNCKKDDYNAAGDVAAITAFSLQGISATFDINQTNGDVTHSGLLPQGTDVANLIAEFETSPGATVLVNNVVQTSGATPNNFTNKVTYYVLSGNKSTAKEYDVFVQVVGGAGTGESKLTAYSIPSLGVDFSINQTSGAITHPGELPMGTDVSALVAEFSFSNGASVQVGGSGQTSGISVNDFTNPVTYSVTSADLSSTTDYVVTVKVESSVPTSDWTTVTNNAGFLAFQDQRAGILNGEIYVMGTSSMAIGGPNSHEVWKSANGVAWSQVTTTPNAFPAYAFCELLNLNNSFHLIGGATLPDFASGTFQAVAQNASFTSSDGASWMEFTGLPFPARVFYRGAVFNNEMYIIGGNPVTSNVPGTASTEIWKSGNSTNWNLVTSAPGFPARSMPAVFVHDGKLWATGGGGIKQPGPEPLFNDVWHTQDGSTWTQVTVASPYPKRTNHSAISYKGKMYVLFGNDNVLDPANRTYFGDLWVSDDNGANWSEVSGTSALPAGFAARGGASVLVDGQDNIWVIGGINATGTLKDVWQGSF